MASYSRVDDALAHHAANTAAVAIPVGSALLRLPEIVTIIVGVMGIIWYGILIGERIVKWRNQWLQIRASARSVAQRLEEERRPTEQKDPEDYQ